jgi:mxaJ protein
MKEARELMGQRSELWVGRKRRFLVAALAASIFAALGVDVGSRAVFARSQRELRVCADPNNMPFSNERMDGFENKLAELIARDLGAKVRYTFWAQRRGFFRNTLKAGACDVVMGVPSGLEMVLTTKPYYRSSYAFVARKDRGIAVRSFDDPALQKLRIGVQMVGDDYVNTPPAHALARRGIINNVVGFMLHGDYAKEVPNAGILRAVESGALDVAVVWGPLAGFFAKEQGSPLAITPVSAAEDAGLPLAFDISMGVRKGEKELKKELDVSLERNREAIERLLSAYGVPRL